mgnify:CR=1 FL=1
MLDLPNAQATKIGTFEDLNVYHAEAYIPHEDVFLAENASFTHDERQDLLKQLHKSKLQKVPKSPEDPPTAFLACDDPQQFNEVPMYILPNDRQVVDLAHGYNFNDPKHRATSLTVLSLDTPRLVFLELFPKHLEGFDLIMHSRWVCDIAQRLSNLHSHFVIAKERTHPLWMERCVDSLRDITDVDNVPVELCRHGFLSQESNRISSFITNVPEIADSIRKVSKSLERKQGKDPRNCELRHTYLLNGSVSYTHLTLPTKRIV